MRAAIADYGAGNLFSLKNALDYIGLESVVTSDAEEIAAADGVFLPGVGAFPEAMSRLEKSGLVPVLRRAAAEKPFMGICLGMQLLFESSEEFGETQGLSLLPGRIVRLRGEGVKIPHTGWSDLDIKKVPCPLVNGLPKRAFVYFVHSYRAETDAAYIMADTFYGEPVPAIVGKGNLFGCQFHPEKSGEEGLTILRNFKELL